MQIGVFFDLDGTLATVHVWQAITRHHRQKGVQRLALGWFLATHYPMFALYKMHLVSRTDAYSTWARDMAWLIGGMTLAQGQAVFDWVADAQVIPSCRPDMLAVLRDHQAQGHRVVLVSGTFQPLLETIAARLGVGECVGTLVEVRNGRYTGRALPPACLGPGKAVRLRQYLAAPGAVIDLTQSFAYADGEWDIPVLELVGHPVAVYPDGGLLAEARKRGWRVIP